MCFSTRFCTAGRSSPHGAAWWGAVGVETKNAMDQGPEIYSEKSYYTCPKLIDSPLVTGFRSRPGVIALAIQYENKPPSARTKEVGWYGFPHAKKRPSDDYKRAYWAYRV